MTTSDEIVQRHRLFWQRGQTDRPIAACWIGSRLPDELYTAARAIPVGRVMPTDIHVDRFLADYDRLQEIHQSVDDDAFWIASPFFGIPWMEAILGCPVHYSGETFWADPIWPEWPEDIRLPLPEGGAWLEKLLEFTRALVERAAGQYGVATTLMRGPSDLAAAVRGHEAMIYDLYDNQQELHRLLEVATSIWIDVARAQLEAIPPLAGGYVSNFYRAWAPDRIIFTQEDASASYSPSLFRQFLLPRDRRITDAFPYSIMHVHSLTVWPIRQWLEVDSLSCLEINYDNNGPRLPELLPLLRAIQERKPLIIRGELTAEEIGWIKQELSPNGLLLNVVAPSVGEARDLLMALKRDARMGTTSL